MEDTAIIDLYWSRNEDALAQTDRKYGPMGRTCPVGAISFIAKRIYPARSPESK